MTAVLIRRRADGKYLTHWAGGIVAFGTRPKPFRSEGHATSIIRIEIGRDLADFEIVEAETRSAPEQVSPS